MWEAVQSRGRRVGSVMVVLVVTFVLLMYNWTKEAALTAHNMPQVEKQNIYLLVRQRKLAAPQLKLVAEQTGLQEEVAANLLELGKWQQLLELQAAYFAPVQVKSVKNTIVTVAEYLVDETGRCQKGTQLADVQTGDILITKNSRFLGWRNGHAGIVVDAEKGLVLEAIMLGTNTGLCPLEKWLEYPSFQVLRLKEEVSWRKMRAYGPGQSCKAHGVVAYMAAAYAKENLGDIPYRLLAGVRGRIFNKGVVTFVENEEEVPVVKGTQCAHLVWYAYMQVGIDLDSDGGLLVTPADIRNSLYLEVVQSYGY